MLLVLQTLAPAGRAVFVLREVFEWPTTRSPDAVGKSPVAARRRRGMVSPAGARDALEAFRRVPSLHPSCFPAARRLFHVGAESITWPCSASWSGAAGDRLPRAREETS
jgi:hypothetical protein